MSALLQPLLGVSKINTERCVSLGALCTGMHITAPRHNARGFLTVHALTGEACRQEMFYSMTKNLYQGLYCHNDALSTSITS